MATLSRIGLLLIVVGFISFAENWDRDFGTHINHTTYWGGIALIIIGSLCRLPKWVNE